ncbi:HAD family hydrolase [Bremerella sp. T1]|uniref:HAD family hydrolase n=1 Tax=Bremerella sp. TYQ1 TaxID=3119568 RepID=UPI001CCC6290|nr:HAD hydrolase-like protein [Bremerella volcania]UBM37551.1 HAD hydrolase-like protein [Bremerella volcania]
MVYQIEPKNEFLVGIDSDGCVFDTMELKHKECFIPNIINYYELQGVSKYAREAAEFVNLYSKSRGINRFPALVEALEWLQKRPEVIERGAKINIPQSLQTWIKEETKLGNPALEAKVAESNDPDLAHCLKWSKAVNETVAGMVRGVAPFPSVRKCLEKLSGKADMLVVSATPNDALNDEWTEHDLRQYVAEICGQEAGNKKETLTNASKYKPNQTLMIGDAPGDYKAAVANDCLFYPINPGDEENSWKRFYDEGIDKFLKLEFAGDYQKMLLEEFDRYLPEKPSWPVVD